MVNFLGPGAFDCARPAGSRPPFTPDNLPGDLDDWFKDCTSPLARDGTEWRATLLNFLIALLRSSVRKSGVAESNIDDDVLTRALRRQGFNFFAAVTGSANAIAINPDPPIAAPELPGMPITLKTGIAANTGGVTLTIGLLSPIAVTWPDGTPLVGGDLPSGHLVTLRHDGTAFRLLATRSPAQIVAQLAAIVPISGNWLWSQNLANGVNTTLTGSAYSNDGALNLGDSAFSGGIFTVGAQTAGLFLIAFIGVAGSATTDLFVANLLNVSTTIGAGTSQTANSAPAAPAISFRRLVAGDTMRFSCRQTVGSSQVINGRLNIIRLGA